MEWSTVHITFKGIYDQETPFLYDTITLSLQSADHQEQFTTCLIISYTLKKMFGVIRLHTSIHHHITTLINTFDYLN